MILVGHIDFRKIYNANKVLTSIFGKNMQRTNNHADDDGLNDDDDDEFTSKLILFHIYFFIF